MEKGTPKHARFYKHDDYYQRKRFNPLLCGVRIEVRCSAADSYVVLSRYRWMHAYQAIAYTARTHCACANLAGS